MTQAALTGEDALSDRDFAKLRSACKASFGISIPDEKRPLAESRLRSLGRTLDERISALVQTFVDGGDDKVVRAVVDALTTNHTFFGRESAHFRFLTDEVLPTITPRLERAGRDLRLWCAAAATGEEPYYLAMLLRHFFGAEYPSWRAGLLATDISTRALDRAKKGVYGRDQVAKLSEEMRNRYFERRGEDRYEVRADVKKDVTFRRFNLMTPRYPFQRPFDVIFCRNVMIYFEERETMHALDQMAACLKPGGWLFIGMAESIRRDHRWFEYIDTGIYRRRER